MDIIPRGLVRPPLPPESIQQIFTIEEKRIPFTYQQAPANCGPLSIVNGLHALKGIDDRFIIPSDFPQTSNSIRNLLADDASLARTTFNTLGREEIKKASCVLQTEHIANLIKRLSKSSNIEIVGDRFSGTILRKDIPIVIQKADWLICNANFHYTSYVRLDSERWLLLDSTATERKPIIVDESRVIDDYSDKEREISYFMAMKLEDKDKINIVKKVAAEIPNINVVRTK